MSQKQIIVTIEGGQSLVETRGFQGRACKDATADLERAMGRTTKDVNTPEFDLKEVRTIGN